MTTPTPPDREIGPAQRIALGYRNNPKFRALVEGIGSLVPGVTAANTYLVERLSALERQRREALFQYLDEAGADLTDELIASDDFLHCITTTVRAAQRTRRNEKIRLFARLLASTTRDQERSVRDVDEFEELLGILDEMSLREFHVLTILERFERGGRGLTPTSSSEFWDEFLAAMASEADVPRDEAGAVLARLNRTGMYSSMSGTFNNMEGRGELTPRWYRLRDLIADAEGKDI